MKNIIKNINNAINANVKNKGRNKLYSRSSRPFIDFSYSDIAPLNSEPYLENDYYKEPVIISSLTKRAKSHGINNIVLAVGFAIAFFVFCLAIYIVIYVLRERVNKVKNNKVEVDKDGTKTIDSNDPNMQPLSPSGFCPQNYYNQPIEFYGQPAPLRGFPPRGYSRHSHSSSFFNFPFRHNYSHSQINIQMQNNEPLLATPANLDPNDASTSTPVASNNDNNNNK